MLLQAACSASLSVDDCIRHWNDGGPRGVVAEEGYALAEVYAGRNKAAQWGCGMVFHSDRGEPWRSFGAIVEESSVGVWDTQTGESWGTDSPEGADPTTVGVRTDGTLRDAAD